MSDFSTALASIASVADQKQKADQYKLAMTTAVSSSNQAHLQQLVDHLLSDAVPLVISRQLLLTFAQELVQLQSQPQLYKSVTAHVLEKCQPRVSFEDAVVVLRENLASLLEQEEQWSQAAQTLAGIDLESSQRQIDTEYKLAKYIKMAMLYLEDDDSVSAETYLKKAASLVTMTRDEGIQLQYKVCYARILDAKRRFLEAGLRFYELSNLGSRTIAGKMVGEEEIIIALQNAIVCTVLAAAGPQRSRMLSSLYKDERSATLDIFPFLEKVYLERILTSEDIATFSRHLKSHQTATLPDGSTVLSKAMMQHNLLAVSRLYANIRVADLGQVLGLEPEKAEAIAADMFREERIRGSIDQVEGLIHFDDNIEPLAHWDNQINSVCAKVNDIIDSLAAAGVPMAL